MSFEKRLLDIRSLKVQGATNVAVAGINALNEFSKNLIVKDSNQYLSQVSKAAAKISSIRSTEPMLRNFLNYVLLGLYGSEITDAKRLKILASQLSSKVIQMKNDAKNKMALYGKNEVPENSIIYTHCHSSSVTSILINAKKSGKKFIVINTETRPRFQGRITALELAKAGIKVTHYVDSAMKLAIKKSDAVFLGADSISNLGVENKVGSGLACELAKNYGIPVFVCAHSFKINPCSIIGKEDVIEQRDVSEVWPKAPKNVKVENPAFERIEPGNITAIISELGVSQLPAFIENAKRNYPWMFTVLNSKGDKR